MSILDAMQRNALPASQFGLPVPDASHARNALARASQQAGAGHLSPDARSMIDGKAHRILAALQGHGR